MKTKFSFILFFLTGFLFSQEFGAKFLTIDENSLPSVHSLNESFFVQKYTKDFFTTNIGITTNNYWQPVSMMDALNKQEAYLNRKNTTKNQITAESLGFRRIVEKEKTFKVEVNSPYSINQNSVKNAVYNDVSIPFLYNPYFNKPVRNRISDF